MTTFESGTNCKLGTTLLWGTLSSIASSLSSLATLPPKADLVPTSSSHSLIIYNERRGKWQMANNLHGGFTHLFMKFQLFYSKVWLICLPAMTSACISKDMLRNHTQVFLRSRNSILRFVYISSISTALLTSYLHWCWAAAREHQTKSCFRKVDSHYSQKWSLYQSSSIEISSFDNIYSIYSFFSIRYVIKYLAGFYPLWCVLCRTDIEWNQSAKKQLAGYIKLNWAIRTSCNEDAINNHDCIPSTLYYYYSWRL